MTAPTRTDGRDIDLAAVKRLLADFRERLQTLDYYLRGLYVAIDGPPGAIAELEDEVTTAVSADGGSLARSSGVAGCHG
ncbi:MAG: hypothetical protein ABSA53_34985 [Streptosporangiaceae bacterium]